MYGFRIPLVDASSVWETRVIYQTEKTAIYVDRSLEYFRVEVWLVRLIDGALPPDVSIKPDTVLHQFLLDDLLALRGSPLLPNPEPMKGLDNEQIEISLESLARALKEYAGDILEGDFSFFVSLEERVKRRAFKRRAPGE